MAEGSGIAVFGRLVLMMSLGTTRSSTSKGGMRSYKLDKKQKLYEQNLKKNRYKENRMETTSYYGPRGMVQRGVCLSFSSC